MEKKSILKRLDKEKVVEIIKNIRNIPNANPVFCGKKKGYIENSFPEFIKEIEKYYEKYEIVDDITKVDDEALKIAICDLTGAEKNLYSHIKKV